jgi:putative endonuclease
MTWFIYIARCGDGSLYTGITNDLARRLDAHSTGRGARYTRGRGGVTLHHWEPARTKSAALRREAAIKRLPREAKLAMTAPPGLRPAAAGDLPAIRRHFRAASPAGFFLAGRAIVRVTTRGLRAAGPGAMAVLRRLRYLQLRG